MNKAARQAATDGPQTRLHVTTWSLGRLLRRYRIAAGLTQETLAERATLSVYTISNLERDILHRPRRMTIGLLAEALSLSDAERLILERAASQRRTEPVPAEPHPRDDSPPAADPGIAVVLSTPPAYAGAGAHNPGGERQRAALVTLEQHAGDTADLRRAAPALLGAVEQAHRAGQYHVEQRLLIGLLPVLLQVVSCTQARRLYRWGVAASRALDDRVWIKWFLDGLGDMHFHLDDWGSAERAWQAGYKLARETRTLHSGLSKIADLARLRGDFETAEYLVGRQLRWNITTENTWGTALTRLSAARHATRRGRAAEAEEELSSAEQALRLHTQRFGQMPGFRLTQLEIGIEHARLQRGPPAAAEGIRVACHLATECCSQHTTARMLVEQAEYATRLGYREGAVQTAQHALAAARSVASRYYARRAATLLRQFNAPTPPHEVPQSTRRE